MKPEVQQYSLVDVENKFLGLASLPWPVCWQCTNQDCTLGVGGVRLQDTIVGGWLRHADAGDAQGV